MQEIVVTYQALLDLARRLDAAADDVAAAPTGATLRGAADAVQGGRLGGACTDAAPALQQAHARLAEDLQQHANRLRRAAANYQRADR